MALAFWTNTYYLGRDIFKSNRIANFFSNLNIHLITHSLGY